MLTGSRENEKPLLFAHDVPLSVGSSVFYTTNRLLPIMASLTHVTALETGNLPKVLYKSDDYLFVSKCHDLKINSDNRDEMTTEHQLRHMFPDLVDDNCKHGFRYVNRLDFATSGILCLGLNRKAANGVWKQFVERNVTKYYLALVRGHVKQDMLYIDIATGALDDKDWPGRRCTPDHPQFIHPKDTKTLFICLERGTYMDRPATKVLLKPYTGRTHQLRVHCDHIGHTIVGDYTYSLRADTEPDRMMLHSHRFIADTGREVLDITSPDPFTSDQDTRWQPCETCNTYETAIEKAEHFDPEKHSEKTYSSDIT